ncbi:prolyl oligopeptidase family serine peptidase [Tundrisphaera sp. TA3]|uniref:prolyl oligopeptidase family serine peptidase n=1 Tax=Tundrisphaera sp. TA3 TaxID=3435775 RepID=UPI003EB80D58
MRSRLIGLGLFGIMSVAMADGPADNRPESVRRIPEMGVEVSAEDRAELEKGLAALGEAIGKLEAKKDAKVDALLPDVRIYHRAVRDALAYREFFAAAPAKNASKKAADPNRSPDIAKAKALLADGQVRANQLLGGSAPWTTQTGPVVRGYTSKLDGSAQPYGLVVPETYATPGASRHRLDVWFHGRGEKLSEVNFIDERAHRVGEFAPADAFVLHPYGRFCNPNRFAGEVDALEALEAARASYRIDPDRIAVRGFSMGGASCWTFATHYSDRWFAANPGAGFSETAKFLNVFQKETLTPTWYEQKLWHLYDATDYARNLLHCPTVAYSGENDRQKQAADLMEEALRAEKIDLVHVIGPGTEHKYHPDSKREVERRLAGLAEVGRQRMPASVDLTTYTLKYNRMHWVTVDALQEHWAKATVRARIAGEARVEVATGNVTALTLDMAPGLCPFDLTASPEVKIDGTAVAAPRAKSDRSWHVELVKENGTWKAARPAPGLRKRHDLQGPIDDAFMDSFLVVRPSGKAKSSQVDAWAKAEADHAVEHWRRQFRGDARVKKDAEVTDADIAAHNLILFGDPSSNAVLRKIADKLPIRWVGDQVVAGDQKFPAGDHAPILIYPNPLNPGRYVVLNSGFTYREYDYLNNARQTPKLPDWAIVDVRTPPDSRGPGKVVAADFFGESWELRPPHRD